MVVLLNKVLVEIVVGRGGGSEQEGFGPGNNLESGLKLHYHFLTHIITKVFTALYYSFHITLIISPSKP